MAAMKNFSFLGTAEARADHLRELSTQLHALDMTSASLSEAEHEIPELELALSVFNRLAPGDGSTSDPEGFVEAAETRAERLRSLSHHMRSLDLTRAAASDVDGEVAELDIAMTVFRRLTGHADEAFAHTSPAHEEDTFATAAAPAGGTSTAEASADDEPADEEPAAMPEKKAPATWSIVDDPGTEAAPATSFSQFARQHLDTADLGSKEA